MADRRRLKRSFFRRDPVALARALLGHELVRRLDDGSELAGRIVEVEAYLGVEDRAAHSYAGRRTRANASMWLDGGRAYVYFVYGMHWCVNVVAQREGIPTACLIRALEPLTGLDRMHRHRTGTRPQKPRKPLAPQDLCSGPAKLTQALAIDKTLDGEDLTTSEVLFLRRGRGVPTGQVVAAARIGVGYAGEWALKPLRFFVEDNPNVSRPRRGGSSRAR